MKPIRTPLERNDWGNCSVRSNANDRDGGNPCQRPGRFLTKTDRYPEGAIYCAWHEPLNEMARYAKKRKKVAR